MSGKKQAEAETLYELATDEAYPVLCLRETDPKHAGEPGVIRIPERLVRRLRDARAAEQEAVNEIARWVKYGSDEQAKLDIRRIIDELPTADERRAERKKR